MKKEYTRVEAFEAMNELINQGFSVVRLEYNEPGIKHFKPEGLFLICSMNKSGEMPNISIDDVCSWSNDPEGYTTKYNLQDSYWWIFD